MVGLGGLEPPTSRLSGVRSNHLSYRPGLRHLFWKGNEDGGQPALSAEPDRQKRPAGRLCCLITACRYPVRHHPGGDDPTAPFDKPFLRKEVIQPQVPLRLPCYDFTPVADPTVVGCLLAVSSPASGKTNSHGVTGGVYKARERIHRGMLIRDY